MRIITGFIEPHFFAGFSGGPKGIMPGTAALQTVMSNHGARNIGDPNAAFGITDGNPLWEEMRDIALRVGPSFLLNVTLNEQPARSPACSPATSSRRTGPAANSSGNPPCSACRLRSTSSSPPTAVIRST